MTRKHNLIRTTLGATLSVGLACLIWEGFARSGLFAPALAPSVVLIGRALVGMLLSGAMIVHIAYTLYRVLFGFLLAGLVGVPIGIPSPDHPASTNSLLTGFYVRQVTQDTVM